jgi:hypothetical protein
MLRPLSKRRAISIQGPWLMTNLRARPEINTDRISAALGRKDKEVAKDRIWETKWASLKARGITPPRDRAEAKKRLKAAHGY